MCWRLKIPKAVVGPERGRLARDHHPAGVRRQTALLCSVGVRDCQCHWGVAMCLCFLITKSTMNVTPVGPSPTSLVCPSCRATIRTRVESKATTKTHVIALLLCLFLCWPCVCVPYCMDSCQNADHYCPNCNSFLGTYQN
ncbi:LITAF-like zinc ribbon domain-containing protein [Phthorimaea operculella]|nr:LITAF-like zinc ribbon domain-containing protein [Phthorimaea operculella]